MAACRSAPPSTPTPSGRSWERCAGCVSCWVIDGLHTAHAGLAWTSAEQWHTSGGGNLSCTASAQAAAAPLWHKCLALMLPALCLPCVGRTLARATRPQASWAATLATRCWATTTPSTSSSEAGHCGFLDSPGMRFGSHKFVVLDCARLVERAESSLRGGMIPPHVPATA